MDWNKVRVPEGAKLFRVHSFTYMNRGTTWHLEVDESLDGTFTGHGEHSTDKNCVLESVSGRDLEDCVSNLIKNARK